ncbi:MAG: flavin reductase family protein [Chloroflexi bacterium]|nr:flavin reductase family protein [Chloroflexota bacterium]
MAAQAPSLSQRVDPAGYRAVLGRYPTGITVVTTVAEGCQPIGTTVNSFTSVSLDPPLVLVAIGRERTIHPVIASTRHFAVNILDEESTALSDCFSGAPSELPREAFCDAAHELGGSGMPLLDAALATIECELDRSIEAGDHTLYLGRITSLAARASESWPLLYFRGRYLRIEHAGTEELLGKPDST